MHIIKQNIINKLMVCFWFTLGLMFGTAQAAAPVVTLTSPAVNQAYATGSTVTISATASEAGGTISKVQFYRGGTTLLSTVTTAPYTYNWVNVAAGSYSITAVATDSTNVSTTSTAVPILVEPPPVVTLTIPPGPPPNGYIAPATINLSATATTNTGRSISKVEFYRASTLIGTVTTAPYNFTWTNVPAGTAGIAAKAYDDLGVSNALVTTSVTVKTDVQPTLTLTSPTASQAFAAPGSITFAATLSTYDGSTPPVEFYNGTTLIGTASSAPYTYTWNSVAGGSYSVTAKATDAHGLSKTTPAITIYVDVPPVVTLSIPAAPSGGYVAPASVTLSATATANNGASLSKVEFYNGATLLGTDTASPFNYAWTNIVAGTYSVTAKAFDSRGITNVSSIGTLTVGVGSQAPTVSLTAPTANQVFTPGASIVLSANAATFDSSTASVSFYNGSNLLGTDASPPYAFTWTNVPAGNYSLTAKATDGHGATTTSTAVPITVDNPPSISLTIPAGPVGGYVAPANVTLSATATGNGGSISKVEFYNGATLLGTKTSSPYSYAWSNITAGTYSVTAKAFDSFGLTNTTPTGSLTVGAGTQIVYLYADHLGTPRLATDSTNNVVWSNLPLGEPFANTPPQQVGNVNGQPFVLNLRFPGQYYDQETGTISNGFRDYDANIGRYIQSDPIGLNGGINTYAYVDGNPLSRIDPLGLEWSCSWVGPVYRCANTPSLDPFLPKPSAQNGDLVEQAGDFCSHAWKGATKIAWTMLFGSDANGSDDTDRERRKKDCDAQYERDVAECGVALAFYGKKGYAVCMERAANYLATCLRQADGK